MKIAELHVLITQNSPLFSLFKCKGGQSAQTYVHIEVEDLNDNAPVFNPDQYAMSISSHAQPGTEILNVIATDRDSGRFGQVTYDLVPGDMSSLFALDKQTGRQAEEDSFTASFTSESECVEV